LPAIAGIDALWRWKIEEQQGRSRHLLQRCKQKPDARDSSSRNLIYKQSALKIATRPRSKSRRPIPVKHRANRSNDSPTAAARIRARTGKSSRVGRGFPATNAVPDAHEASSRVDAAGLGLEVGWSARRELTSWTLGRSPVLDVSASILTVMNGGSAT